METENNYKVRRTARQRKELRQVRDEKGKEKRSDRRRYTFVLIYIPSDDTMINKLKIMWKEAVLAEFKVLSRNFPGKNHENLSPDIRCWG
jgi:hypothetical protein